jgi:hypothetical protein
MVAWFSSFCLAIVSASGFSLVFFFFVSAAVLPFSVFLLLSLSGGLWGSLSDCVFFSAGCC